MAIRRIFISSISAGGRPYISSFTVDDAAVDINAMVTAYNLLCNGLVVSVSEALQLVHPSDRRNPAYVTQAKLDLEGFDSVIAKGYYYNTPNANEPEHKIRALLYLEGVNSKVTVDAGQKAEDKVTDFLKAWAGIGAQSLVPTGAVVRLVPQGT